MTTLDRNDPRVYTGHGGYWVSRLARDADVFRIADTKGRGVKLHMPDYVHFVSDASFPGGVRVTIPTLDVRHVVSLTDWNAATAYAAQLAALRVIERDAE